MLQLTRFSGTLRNLVASENLISSFLLHDIQRILLTNAFNSCLVRYIDEEDLFRFMNKEEIDNVLPLFEGGVETGKIKRKTLKNWLVNL